MKNSQKGFILRLIILIVIIAIVAVGVYAYQRKKSELFQNNQTVLDQQNVYFSSQNQGLVTLYSTDAKQNIVPNPYCGSAAGQTEYTGDFILSFNGKDLDLGNNTFDTDSDHDGKMLIQKLGSSQDFILLAQYRDCNDEEWSAYGLDAVSNSLKQYQFSINNEQQNSIDAGPGQLKSVANGVIESTQYDNATGKTTTTDWKFDPATNKIDGTALVGSGSSTPTDYTGWQTYANSQYGFSFKYPVSLVQPTPTPITGSITLGEGENGIIVFMPRSFSNGSTTQSFNDFMSKYYEGDYTITQMMVGNIPSIGVSSSQIGDNVYVPFPSNQVLQILGNFSSPIFKEILSTFVFSPSVSIGSSALNWQTYLNQQYRFSFQYPLGFDQQSQKYISLTSVPPVVTIIPTTATADLIDAKGCYINISTAREAGPEENQVMINSIPFCESIGSNPGMGSYTESDYYTALENGNYITIGFNYGATDCGIDEGDSDYHACQDAITSIPALFQKSVGSLLFIATPSH